MEVQLASIAASEASADWLILPVTDSAPPAAAAELAERLREQSDLETGLGSLTIVADCSEVAATRVCFVGCTDNPDDIRDLNKPLAAAFQKVLSKGAKSVAIALPPHFPSATAVGEIVRTCVVCSEGQGIYQADQKRSAPDLLTIIGSELAASSELMQAIDRGRIIGESTNVTRELVNRHAGDIYPETFAHRAQQLAADAGLTCEVYDEEWMRNEKFGSMLAVAQGSDQSPRLVVLRHNGGGPDAPTYGLCGKGVTFDSGGLSLKPSDSMNGMKADMAGGATVLGTMLAVARLNLPVNIVASIGLVENMISGHSYRLGDVLTARNGITIEVLNTDAEGRLVLADVLSWTVDQGATRMIDLATLTGACVVALGEDISGLFPNDDEWATQILDAAESEGEYVWQMPMHDMFSDQLKSDVADCKNIGTRWGGAVTAAKFLEKFVGDATWAHLDIAGPAYATSSNALRDGGGTGAMVRTLVRLFERA